MKPVESRMAVLISLALLVILTIVAPVIDANAGRINEDGTITFLDLRVEGDVITPDGPCHENVHIEDTAVVVADVIPIGGVGPGPHGFAAGVAEIRVHITLADVQGTGETTGATYLATGAVQMDFATPSLPTTLQGVATFAWIPLGPCRLPRPQAETLSLPVELAVDANGHLAPNGRLVTISGGGEIRAQNLPPP